MSTPICSVLILSRNRAQSLPGAIDTFLDTALEPDRVEIIVRLHDDDEHSLAWAKTRPSRIRVVIGDSADGYASLSEFSNCIAAISRGDWLWPACDDGRVHTPGWDRMLKERLDEPRSTCLYLKSSFPGSQLCIITRGFYRALGHAGMTEHADTYTGSLARAAGIEESIDIDYRHLNLPPVCQRNRQQTWDQFRSEEVARCFTIDKLKLGAVIGSPIQDAWTTSMMPPVLIDR